MTNLNKRQAFKYQIYNLLNAIANDNGIAVLKRDDETQNRPYVWVEIETDKYSSPTDESAASLAALGKKNGECLFTVYGRVTVDADTGTDGTLEDEADRVVDFIEEAIDTGTPTQLNTSRYRLVLLHIMTTESGVFLDTSKEAGLVGVSGVIRYDQTNI